MGYPDSLLVSSDVDCLFTSSLLLLFIVNLVVDVDSVKHVDSHPWWLCLCLGVSCAGL